MDCRFCGAALTKRWSKLYCSRACANKATAPVRTANRRWVRNPKKTYGPFTCRACGQVFGTNRLTATQTPVYCSRRCCAKDRQGMSLGRRKTPASLICDHCGRSYETYPCRKARRFCSRECQIASAYITRTCATCGQDFSVKRSLRRRIFCSSECYWRANCGPDNGHWKGSLYPYYYGSQWDRQAEKARLRDGFRCRVCGLAQADNYRALDVHHIKPFTQFKRVEKHLANRLSNLITLCHPCHMGVECGKLPLPS